ncbi:uncharacterized protein ACJ7VT_009490 [Polymixia lowei]
MLHKVKAILDNVSNPLRDVLETQGRKDNRTFTGFQRNVVFPPSLDKLLTLLEDKLHVLQNSENQQSSACEDTTEEDRGVRRYAILSQELTFDLRELQSQTEQELTDIHSQLGELGGRLHLLTSELWDLEERKRETDQELKRNPNPQTCTFLLGAHQELQASIAERSVQSERLVFQEKALSALCSLLNQDLQRYQEETQKLTQFTQRTLGDYHRPDQEEPPVLQSFTHRGSQDTQGNSEMDQHNHMQSGCSVNGNLGVASHPPRSSSPTTPLPGLARGTNLNRSGSVKELIYKFSGSDNVPSSGSPQSSSPVASTANGSLPGIGRATGTSPPLFSMVPDSGYVEMIASESRQNLKSSDPSRSCAGDSPVPSISVTPPYRETRPDPNSESAQSNTKDTPVPDNSKIVKERQIANAGATPAQKTGPESGSSAQKTDDRSPKVQNGNGSGRESTADSGMGSESEFESNKQPDSPASEEEPTTPRVLPSHNQNVKYQLYLNNEQGNGLSGRDADGPGGSGAPGENGPRLARWESARLGLNHYRGSLESLASRDWDTMSDRFGGFDSPPRVFNSPYTTAASMEYNPMYRMSEFKVQGGVSPASSEFNLFSYNSRSSSPVPATSLSLPRSRFSTYDTLARRRAEVSNAGIPNHMTLRSATLGAPNKRDYIEELTKQLDTCQRRNQFLEAESVELDKERNQIRLEMRTLLVSNEDLLRTNTQLTNENKRMRDRMTEVERECQTMTESYRQMEIELKEARDMMVEANTQEYAFNFLQQSLKNKLQDAEENLEKQTQHAQTLSDKLWLAERQLEELELERETRDKKTSELSSTIFRLETELGEVIQASTQAGAELSLQQKLREDALLRVESLEDSLLEKDQELQRVQATVSRLQGEVSGKLIDKEQTLEEEIQLRERIQLQCKQAERTVDDLHMELQTANQAKDDLAKQLKQAQENMIDLESDIEELRDSEQRWATKHKRAIEQTEQLQLKLIQEKDLTDQLECEKTIMERQVRQLRLEVDELQSSKVQEDVISKTENRAKELENSLRMEERNKVVLTNTIAKMERKINELSDQMEEEHKIATEQKDLMTQRIRSLKRQVNEAEEESSRKEAQYRHTQRELTEERETTGRLQRQLLDQHLQMKRKESLMMRQTLDNLRLDLSVDEEDNEPQRLESVSKV